MVDAHGSANAAVFIENYLANNLANDPNMTQGQKSAAKTYFTQEKARLLKAAETEAQAAQAE